MRSWYMEIVEGIETYSFNILEKEKMNFDSIVKVTKFIFDVEDGFQITKDNHSFLSNKIYFKIELCISKCQH